MIQKIKLTTSTGKTRGGMEWTIGVTNRATGKGRKLCTDGVLHYYDHALLAVLMNPIHAVFRNPLAFEVRGRQVVSDGLMSGAKSLTVIRRIELPTITLIQRAAFGILCSLELPQSESYCEWANDWLSSKNRETWMDVDCAMETTKTITSATWAKNAAAAVATEDARWVAKSAAMAAAVVKKKLGKIDFITIAIRAMEIK